MTERKRTCIPFKTIKFKVGQGAGLGETLSQVKSVTNSLKNKIFEKEYLQSLPIKNQLLHNLAYTAIGITLAVSYEYARLKLPGLGLPSLEPMIPAASLTPSTGSSSREINDIWPEGTTEYDKDMARKLFNTVVDKGASPKDTAKAVSNLVEKVAEERREKKK